MPYASCLMPKAAYRGAYSVKFKIWMLKSLDYFVTTKEMPNFVLNHYI